MLEGVSRIGVRARRQHNHLENLYNVPPNHKVDQDGYPTFVRLPVKEFLEEHVPQHIACVAEEAPAKREVAGEQRALPEWFRQKQPGLL